MRERRQVSLVLSISLLLLVLIMVQSATGFAATANGATRYVAQGGTDIGDCTILTDPCGTVQYALDSAGNGDIIKIAAGTYTDVHSRPAPEGYVGAEDVLQVAYIDKTVTLQGGYLAPDFAEPPDPVANQTILDAEDKGRVLFIAGEVAPRIEGLRITDGNAADLGGGIEGSQDAGGGVYIMGTEAALVGNWVYGNVVEWWGGGLYLSQSSSLLEGNVVAENEATDTEWGHGGGLALVSSDARLYRNTVSGNQAKYKGGGIYLSSSDAILLGNVVDENRGGDGGGLELSNCDAAVLRDNIIAGNDASIGGGLLLNNSDVAMIANMVTGNSASLSGGGIAMWWSKPNLDGNTISGNTLTGDCGGGVYLSWYSDAILTNNLIAGNRATYAEHGAALCVQDSAPRLLHTTIVSNTGSGGAVSVIDYYAHSSIAMTNTILASHTLGIAVSTGNTATLEATFWGEDDWANDVDWEGEGEIDLGDINVRGDPAFTCTGSGCSVPYRLGTDSAALDEGVPTGIRTDIDAELRPYQAPDLGADEYWPPGVLRWIYLPLVLRSAP
ncbi:MAG: NosD domain-containing protein [Anaerolineae bacterium]